ncbi:MAG TPA: glycine betaine ABC transporter substrate-binding protein [Thermoleophilaceae bacterium]|nr:glycine betaine ABC transporter substrate-binding protein [Thermoleophilaceae bacterium]
MKIHRLTGLLAVLCLLVSAFAMAACGDDEEEGGGTQTSGEQQAAIESNPDNQGTTITVGSKNFTEQKVLGEVFAQGLEAAGFTVEKQLNLGDEKTAFAALRGGEIDAYPEYTGTALLSFFGVRADRIPKDPQEAFEQVRTNMEERNVTALPPTPFTSSNEVGVTRETAQQNDLQTISDLSQVDQEFTLYGSPECRQRTDCLLGLQQVYDLDFQRFRPVDIALRHEVLTKGQADASIVFTTDPQIKREGFVLLEDDKNMFPPYNSTLLVRNQIAQGETGQNMQDVVEQVQEGLTAEVMQELNARVDLDKKTPEQVAGEYLRESGLVR